MSDAPERVTLHRTRNTDTRDHYEWVYHDPPVEYIRADIHGGEVMAWQHQYREAGGYANELRAENARLREALEEICDRTDDVDELWMIAHDALEADHE